MSVRKQRRKLADGSVREFYMVHVKYEHPDGRITEVRKVPPVQTRRGAEEYERQVRQSILDGTVARKEVPTFEKWFENTYMKEWVLANGNGEGTLNEKKSIFRTHLRPVFGALKLDAIDEARIARFKASLFQNPRIKSNKTRNNILTALSNPLRCAERARIIARAPRVGLFKTERPEIEWLEFEEYNRLLNAALIEGPGWYGAVCLAGEAGLRQGEVRALRWREDVDLIGMTITVQQSIRHKRKGTPKGRRRRTVPMTQTLLAALKNLDVVRTGYVVRDREGESMNEGKYREALSRICRRAGLPEFGWHRLRHSFGTHAAFFGVNPWRLQAWMGHQRIDETMLYVHVAEAHPRPIPPVLVEAGAGESDPDRRILAMMSARVHGGATRTEEARKLA